MRLDVSMQTSPSMPALVEPIPNYSSQRTRLRPATSERETLCIGINMTMTHPGLPVLAALVPTRDRLELLDRALRSIWDQSLKPNVLVLIDDARVEASEHSPDFETIAAFALRLGIEPILLKNRRSPGLAGACNTGLDELQRRHPAEQKLEGISAFQSKWRHLYMANS